jgi:hypothetical protein
MGIRLCSSRKTPSVLAVWCLVVLVLGVSGYANAQQEPDADDATQQEPDADDATQQEPDADDATKVVSSAAQSGPYRDPVGDLNRRSIRAGEFPGSIRLPGPRGVSLGIGGFVKAIAIKDTDAERIGADYLPALLGTRSSDEYGNFSIDATLTRMHFDARASSKGNSFRGYLEFDLNAGNDGELGFKGRHAFGTWKNSRGTLLFGHTWSTAMDLKVLPESLSEPTASGYLFTRQPIIRWTMPLLEKQGDQAQEKKVTFYAAIEDASNDDVFSDDPTPDLLTTDVPDGVLGLEFERMGVGHLRLNGLVRKVNVNLPNLGRDSDVGWALGLTGALDLSKSDRFTFSGVYGEGVGRYLLGLAPTGAGAVIDPTSNELRLRTNWGANASYLHYWGSDDVRSTALVGYAQANRSGGELSTAFESSSYASVNLMWSPFPYLTVGIEYYYGRRDNIDGSSLDNHRVGIGIQVF